MEMKKIARTTGLLYLIIIVCGLFSEMAVRSQLLVPGDAAATAGNIVASESLYRLGFVSDLIMVLCDIGVGLALYVLLKPVSQGLALLAAFFRLAQASVVGLNSLNHFAVLLLLGNSTYHSAFEPDQINSLVMFSLEAHSYGYLISGVFFGFSCLVAGFLLIKSAHFPAWLGGLLILAGVTYVVDCGTNFLAPAYAEVTDMLLIATAVPAELAMALFLLIKGILTRPATVAFSA